MSVASAMPNPGLMAFGLKPYAPNVSMNFSMVAARIGSAPESVIFQDERSTPSMATATGS